MSEAPRRTAGNVQNLTVRQYFTNGFCNISLALIEGVNFRITSYSYTVCLCEPQIFDVILYRLEP